MRRRVEDERVLLEKRKIGSDGFQIVFFALLISILVQQFIFNAPFIQYAYEFILFITISIYILFRNYIVGNDLYETYRSTHKMNILTSVVCGMVVAVINLIQRGTVVNFGTTDSILIFGVTFVSAALTAFVGLTLYHTLNKNRQKKLEARLDEDN